MKFTAKIVQILRVIFMQRAHAPRLPTMLPQGEFLVQPMEFGVCMPMSRSVVL